MTSCMELIGGFVSVDQRYCDASNRRAEQRTTTSRHMLDFKITTSEQQNEARLVGLVLELFYEQRSRNGRSRCRLDSC